MVRNKQCAALVTLYDREIIRCLEQIRQEPEKGVDFAELLPPERIQEIIGESENSQDFAKKLFEELKSSSDRVFEVERLYKNVMTFLQTNMPNSTLHQMLKCTDRNVRISEFHYILNNLDDFLRFTDPETVLSYLDSYPQYNEIVTAIRQEIDRNESEDVELYKKLVLRTVPLMGEFAVFDIMYTISEKTNDNNIRCEAREFIERILDLKAPGGFSRYYSSICSDRFQRNGRIYVCPVHESATEMMVYLGSGSLDLNPRYRMINIRYDNIVEDNQAPRLVIESVRQRIHLQRPLTLRSYQEELCQVALRNENTIVTAPTGSGKTVIAANILKNHFETRQAEGKRFKALFMTPNSMILKQQADSLSSYLEHAYHTQIVQGADNLPTRNVIQSKDLIVATPQMIVNLCLEHLDESRGEGMEKFYLSTFTIIFFDECHNTLKKSPYANIMREYHKLKNMGNLPTGHQLPQIIGLTASLGTGDAKNTFGVLGHIATLCASMDVQEISIVKLNIDELRRFSPIVPDVVQYCERSTSGPIGEFTTSLCHMMKEVEKLIFQALAREEVRLQPGRANEQERDYQPETNFVLPPEDKELQKYQNWVCEQKNVVSAAKFRENHTKIVINEALEVLESCFWTLSYNANFNPTVALKYLREEMTVRTRHFTPEMTMIWERYHNRLATNGTDDNPMVLEVERKIVEQNEQNDDSRTIIFVKTRYEAKILRDILNENETLRRFGIKSEWLSGLNKTSSSSEIAASKQKQMEKLKQFASGEIRVLVSTSVAEEGLDVAECNLVIKYNYATNEIAHVQRRGRGRALNSTCVLITNSRSLQDQESMNRDKESMMTLALLEIQSTPASFKSKVIEEIRKIWPRILNEDTENAQRVTEQRTRNITYQINCKKCDKTLCTNHEMRARSTQYIVCSPQFWNLVRKVQMSQQEMEANRFHATGKIFCRGINCGASLGQLIDVNSTDLPCLSANSIVLVEQGSQKRFPVKKWKQILENHFTPINIRQLDILSMRQADQSSVPTFESFMENGVIDNIIRDMN